MENPRELTENPLFDNKGNEDVLKECLEKIKCKDDDFNENECNAHGDFDEENKEYIKKRKDECKEEYAKKDKTCDVKAMSKTISKLACKDFKAETFQTYMSKNDCNNDTKKKIGDELLKKQEECNQPEPEQQENPVEQSENPVEQQENHEQQQENLVEQQPEQQENPVELHSIPYGHAERENSNKNIKVVWLPRGEPCDIGQTSQSQISTKTLKDTLLSCKGMFEIEQIARGYQSKGEPIQVAATSGNASIESALVFFRNRRQTNIEPVNDEIMVIPELDEFPETQTLVQAEIKNNIIKKFTLDKDKYYEETPYNKMFEITKGGDEKKDTTFEGSLFFNTFKDLSNTTILLFTTKELIEKQLENDQAKLKNLKERSEIDFVHFQSVRNYPYLVQTYEFDFDKLKLSKNEIKQFELRTDRTYVHKECLRCKKDNSKDKRKSNIFKYHPEGNELNVVFFVEGETLTCNALPHISCLGYDTMTRLGNDLRERNFHVDVILSSINPSSIESSVIVRDIMYDEHERASHPVVVVNHLTNQNYDDVSETIKLYENEGVNDNSGYDLGLSSLKSKTTEIENTLSFYFAKVFKEMRNNGIKKDIEIMVITDKEAIEMLFPTIDKNVLKSGHGVMRKYIFNENGVLKSAHSKKDSTKPKYNEYDYVHINPKGWSVYDDESRGRRQETCQCNCEMSFKDRGKCIKPGSVKSFPPKPLPELNDKEDKKEFYTVETDVSGAVKIVFDVLSIFTR